LPDGLRTLEAHMPFDLVLEIKSSKFFESSLLSKEEFEEIAKYIGFSVIGSTSMEIKNSLTPYTLALKK